MGGTQILESDSKLDLLRQHVRNLQEGRTTVSMRVRRTNLLEDVVSIFAEMEGDTIYYPIQVQRWPSYVASYIWIGTRTHNPAAQKVY